LPSAAWSERPEALRWLRNWLICWIVLPNAGFWLLWIVGGPSRSFPILVTGAVGILLHRAPFALRFAGFLGCTIWSVLLYISALFNLSIVALLYSLQFAAELSPSASVEYMVAGTAVAATVAAAWQMFRRPTRLVEPRRFVIAMAAVIIAASVEGAMAEGDRGSYKRVPVAGAPFTSAVSQSGFGQAADGRHLVMVMVEAMGQPADPALRRRLVELFARPEVRARYEVTSGDTLFYGSTTSGEIRELCGRWGDYYELRDRQDETCLPARLAAAGYETSAWHGFEGSFFERTSWYPNIGFDEMRFGRGLASPDASTCPGVFPGACDRDVPRAIGEALKAARQPQFLYWLTLNTHLPVVRSESLHTDDCARFDPALNRDSPMICRLLQLFDETGAGLAREIAAADFPATDVLIVGDHIPPFFDRHHRRQFEPDRVPWILLRARRPSTAGSAPAGTAAAVTGG
jgi:hypothetical protein